MKKWLIIIIPVVLGVLLYFHDVPTDLTDKDKESLAFFGRLNNTSHLNHAELSTTLIDQMQILIRKDYGIPKGKPREPQDLVRFRTGKCYDWCRTAYKFFKFHDIPVRYVSLYGINDNLFNLLKPGIASHCGLEIELDEQWVYVDPFYNWIAQDAHGHYLGVHDLLSRESGIIFQSIPEELKAIVDQNAIAIYGLYSRHGRFYPPYSVIPDFSYNELKLNF